MDVIACFQIRHQTAVFDRASVISCRRHNRKHKHHRTKYQRAYNVHLTDSFEELLQSLCGTSQRAQISGQIKVREKRSHLVTGSTPRLEYQKYIWNSRYSGM